MISTAGSAARLYRDDCPLQAALALVGVASDTNTVEHACMAARRVQKLTRVSFDVAVSGGATADALHVAALQYAGRTNPVAATSIAAGALLRQCGAITAAGRALSISFGSGVANVGDVLNRADELAISRVVPPPSIEVWSMTQCSLEEAFERLAIDDRTADAAEDDDDAQSRRALLFSLKPDTVEDSVRKLKKSQLFESNVLADIATALDRATPGVRRGEAGKKCHPACDVAVPAPLPGARISELLSVFDSVSGAVALATSNAASPDISAGAEAEEPVDAVSPAVSTSAETEEPVDAVSPAVSTGAETEESADAASTDVSTGAEAKKPVDFADLCRQATELQLQSVYWCKRCSQMHPHAKIVRSAEGARCHVCYSFVRDRISHSFPLRFMAAGRSASVSGDNKLAVDLGSAVRVLDRDAEQPPPTRSETFRVIRLLRCVLQRASVLHVARTRRF